MLEVILHASLGNRDRLAFSLIKVCGSGGGPVKILGCKVWPKIRAVSKKGAELHQSILLEKVLASHDVLTCK
jgi:hypothetical protein